MDDNPYSAPRAPLLQKERANAVPTKRRLRQLLLVAVIAFFAYVYGRQYFETGEVLDLSLVVVCIIFALGTTTIFIEPRLEPRVDLLMRILCPLAVVAGFALQFFG